MNEPQLESSRAPLIKHLLELRNRLIAVLAVWIVATLISYLFVQQIYAFLVEPLAQAFPESESRRLIYTSLTETFVTYIKLACYTGLFVAFPFIASQLYLFIAPGLYKKEKRVLLPYLIGGPMLFFMGVALAYFFVMPLAWKFFVSFEALGNGSGLPITLEAKVSEYLALVLQVMMAFGLAFQLPIILTLLVRVGLLKTQTLAQGRKYAVVILLTIAAILTPPDILSQIMLFIPLYILYEFAILACRRIEKTRSLQNQDNEDARPQMDT